MASNRFVIETSINYGHFHCCGDEGLYPLRGSRCGRGWFLAPSVYALSKFVKYVAENRHSFISPDKLCFSCPACRHPFEFHFMQNEENKATVMIGYRQTCSSIGMKYFLHQ